MLQYYTKFISKINEFPKVYGNKGKYHGKREYEPVLGNAGITKCCHLSQWRKQICLTGTEWTKKKRQENGNAGQSLEGTRTLSAEISSPQVFQYWELIGKEWGMILKMHMTPFVVMSCDSIRPKILVYSKWHTVYTS